MVRMAEDDYPVDDDAQHDVPADAARARLRKTADAFRTISEVADELHVPQHVLRFWETKFPQVRPLKRGGGRRYYRPEDVLLLRRVADLLYTQGYTIKGVQRLLREGGGALHENIPPASAEERLAAEVERHAPVAEPAAKKPGAPQVVPELPMPGLSTEPESVPETAQLSEPEAAPLSEPSAPPAHVQAPNPVMETAPDAAPDAAADAAPDAAPDTAVVAENERLRLLLTETLQALEELRRLIA
jgi:DNA-binding transcriptional MerR regulator